MNNKTNICIILISGFLLKTFDSIFKFLNNDFGLPILRFQELFFLIFPTLFLLFNKRVYNNIIFPSLSYVVIFFATHIYMELYLYNYTYNSIKDIDLIYRFYYLIVAYIAFINLNEEKFYYVIKVFIACIFLNNFIIYLDLFGIVNALNISFGSLNFSGRLYSDINLNTINDQNVLAIILCFYLTRANIKTIKFSSIKIPINFISYSLIPLIFLNASRGSFILLILFGLYFVIVSWERLSMSTKLFYISASSLILIFSFDSIFALTSSSSLIERFTNIEFNEAEGEGRLLQIIASYENFRESPLIGVGYLDAANNIFEGITRSNFHYTQILASGGIFFFIIYLTFVYKLLFQNIKTVTANNDILLLLLYVILLFSFRRPDSYLYIIAYYTYIVSKKYRFKT